MTPPLQVSEVVEVEEALRRAEIGDYLYDHAYQYGDGQSDPREFGIEWHWQQSKPNEFGQGVLLAEAVAWHECMSEDGAETEAYKLRAFIRTLQSENEALRAAGEEARRALEPLLQDPSRTNWASPTTGWFRLASKAHRGLEEVLGEEADA